MNRIRTSLLAVTVATLAATTQALADGAPLSARATVATTVRLASTNLGRILVNGSGSTLFVFTRDGRNLDRCVKTKGCSSVWPVLAARGKPTAGAGLKSSLLSTVRLPGGKRQVSYDGHPLYTYSFSSGPGDTSYVGASEFGGSWYALGANGHAVK
jgi:predicted lipoprotein with Yx(FWY)xxD motif